ncbi:hypothetical protein ACHAXS_008651 [Conticribra weissflogii]
MNHSNTTNEDNFLEEYALSNQFLSDGEPVRCVAVRSSTSSSTPSTTAADGPVLELLSGSQGGIISQFIVSLKKPAAAESSTENSSESPAAALNIQPGGPATRHPHQITAILSSSSFSSDDNSYLAMPNVYITGCKDGIIRVMDGLSHELQRTLEGHSNAVTSLAWIPPPSNHGELPWLVSGSWDGTARIWDVATWSCLATLAGHENTVSVAGLPPGDATSRRVVTASAGVAQGNVIRGHSVRIWTLTPDSNSQPPLVRYELTAQTSDDHAGPIRDVCYDLDTDAIYTCSNDGTVKIRSVDDGTCLETLAFPEGEAPMLLSLCVVGSLAGNSKAVVAGAEDGNVIVWNIFNNHTGNDAGNGGVQVIPHPGCVWNVTPFVDPIIINGDNNSFHNNTDFLTTCHDGHIRHFTRHPSLLASPSVLASFQQSVEAHYAQHHKGPTAEEIAKLPQWEMNALTYGRSEGQVQLFRKGDKAIAAQWSMDSKTWIEVGEVTGTNSGGSGGGGAPGTTQSGTINGKFYQHVLPIEIDLPSGGVQTLQIGYNTGENPFVVAQNFIDEHMLNQGYLGQIADYIRQRVGETGVVLGGDVGGGGAIGGAGNSFGNGVMPMETTPTYNHLPMIGYKLFDSGIDKKGLGKVLQKIREFNDSDAISNAHDSQQRQLTPNELNDLLDSLCNTLATTNRYHSSTISNTELSTLSKMISMWGASHSFPALDLARMTVLHPDAAREDRRGYWEGVLNGALDTCLGLGNEGMAKEVAVPMLTMRLVANSFKGGVGSSEAARGLMDR